MPVLELTQKIEFNVDQMTIDRVEALAAINGLDLDAWFRRLVDDLIQLGSRHMGIDHVEIETVRKPVFDIIELIANKLHPLREKARALLAVGIAFNTKEKKKKIRGKKGKKLIIDLEEEAHVKDELPLTTEKKFKKLAESE